MPAFWPLAIQVASLDVRFWNLQPLWWPLRMSAYDPKRTSTSSLKVVHFEQTRRPDRLTLGVEPKEISALIGSGNGELATKRFNHQCCRMPTTIER